jgi:hypothetical protein
VLLKRLSGFNTEKGAVADPYQCNVLAGSYDLRFFLAQVKLGHRPQFGGLLIQPAIIYVKNRFIAKHACHQEVSRILSAVRHHNPKPGYMGKPGMQSLRVLRALLAAPVDNAPNS